MTDIYDLLRVAMDNRFGGSVTRLAEACDVSVALASRWVHEDGRKRMIPGPASCEKIAGGLDTDPDYVLQLAGHRKPREPMAEVDATRQAIRDQLDRWLQAVGPDHEAYFWQHLKVSGDSAVDLIQQLGTAVSAGQRTAVSDAVSRPERRRNQRRGTDSGPLGVVYHALAMTLSAFLGALIAPGSLTAWLAGPRPLPLATP